MRRQLADCHDEVGAPGRDGVRERFLAAWAGLGARGPLPRAAFHRRL